MLSRYFFLILAVIILLTQCNLQKEDPVVTEKELSGHIDFLASKNLKGRFPGTPEDLKAAHYIADEFSKSGLKRFTHDGLQPFEIITSVTAGPNNLFETEGFQSSVNIEFAPAPFSSSGEIEANVVFAGYGFEIEDEKVSWDDYTGINVENKWVMVLRGNPEPDNNLSAFNPYSTDRDKALVAKDHGAGGILLVSGLSFDPGDELIQLQTREFSAGIPVIQIKRILADRILGNSGNNVTSLEETLQTTRGPKSFETGVRVRASADVRPLKDTTYNVVAYLEGTDPYLKNQYIIFGAHYDHLGMGGPGTTSRLRDTMDIHYGADDNASGVAAVIEIAERLALTSPKPERTFVFVAFGAEEMGLLGSKFFTNNLPFPADSVDLMINLDMVGRLRDNSLQVSGTGTSLEAEGILTFFSSFDSLDLALSPEGYGASDHTSFYGKDIPVLFMTTGVHEDYHTPGDRPEKINYPGMVKVAELAVQVADSISNRNAMLSFREAGPKVQYTRPYGKFKVTLGIMPDITSSDTNTGMRVEFVTPGKPAYRGGMNKGDFIIAIDGKPVNNVYDYMHRLEKLEYGQIIIVTVKRDDEQIDLMIEL